MDSFGLWIAIILLAIVVLVGGALGATALMRLRKSTRKLATLQRSLARGAEETDTRLATAEEKLVQTRADFLRAALDHTRASRVASVDSERAANGKLRVAAILDEFSAAGFEPFSQMVHLEPQTWRAQMEELQPDLFFCESAWSGRDSVKHPWQGKIYHRLTGETENRIELLEILAYCKEHGIPSVFWNKEDPLYFDHGERNFVDTARLFDHVFTTDENCVARYRAEGFDSVDVLQFAVNPELYYAPREGTARRPEVVFAGSWYHDLPERNRVMTEIFRQVIASPYDLVIYDRHSEAHHPNHQYPEEFRAYIRPSVSQEELAQIFREVQFGLTINTVTDSPTMYARRAYEILASGAVLLSNYSVGLERDFGEAIVFVDRGSDALAGLSEAEIARLSDLGPKVVEAHTYEARWGQILNSVMS